MNSSYFVWNCQGPASSKFYRVLKSLLQGYKPDVVVLVEPRISGAKANRVMQKIGYRNAHRVEAVGYSGGIWLLQHDLLSVQIVANHKQFIHTSIRKTSKTTSIAFTAIYGSPNASQREHLWRDLLSLQIGDNKPQLVAGDFNATLEVGDRKGGSHRYYAGCWKFQKFVQEAGLVDLGFSRPWFTWQRGGLMVRLDRALSNKQWISAQPNMTIMHLSRLQSDIDRF